MRHSNPYRFALKALSGVPEFAELLVGIRCLTFRLVMRINILLLALLSRSPQVPDERVALRDGGVARQRRRGREADLAERAQRVPGSRRVETRSVWD